MTIVEKLLTPNEFSRPQRPLRGVKAVVIHYVGKANQKANDVIAYFNWLAKGKYNTYASAHYIVDFDKTIYRIIPENETAYHCGAKIYKDGILDKIGIYPNYYSIGIEMCHNEHKIPEAVEDATAELTANILERYYLNIENLYRHYDITGKLCPKFYVDDENLWRNFKNKVAKILYAR